VGGAARPFRGSSPPYLRPGKKAPMGTQSQFGQARFHLGLLLRPGRRFPCVLKGLTPLSTANLSAMRRANT
jgi:hypothetical protein